MSDDKLYCINGEWMPYSDAHNIYGYTLSKAVQLTLYRQDTTTVNIRKDTSNDTLWDSPNHRWVGSIANLNLYQKLGKITLYKCESPTIYDSYNQALSSTTATHVDVESLIVPITELYETEGITTHPCKNYYTKDGEILCWYDDVENLYWNNKVGYKMWQQTPPGHEVDPIDMSDFDILNIDMRPSLEQYTLTQEQMSNVEFMRFSIDMNVEFLDEGMSASDYDTLNLPIDTQLQLYNVTQPMQLIYIRV